MKKSSRQAIYDWLVRHEGDYGKVRTSCEVSMADHNRIKANIYKNYKYATLSAERIHDNKYRIFVRIKEKEEVV